MCLTTTAATEEDTVCVLTCTSLVVARWMSAPAWTSRSTTSVWPFLLATYTGLIPSYMEVKNDRRNIFPLYIRPSVDGLCRDGPSEISRDPRRKRPQTQPKRLGWV